MSIWKSIRPLSQKAESALQIALGKMPEVAAGNFKLRAFSLLKIPMIAFLNPRILKISDDGLAVKIPLNYRSKNHLNSMYFGALAVGADMAVGLLAMRFIDRSQERISLIFKDFQAEYLKRAEGDVQFICDQGAEIAALVQQAITSGERVEKTIDAYATVPDKLFDEPVARFKLTLSLKAKKKTTAD